MTRVVLASFLAIATIVTTGLCRLAEEGSSSGSKGAPKASPREARPSPEPTPEATVAATPATAGPADGGTTAQDPKLARNFYVVFDGSGSMTYKDCSGEYGRKLPAAQWAFQEFLTAVPEDANLGLLVFDKRGVKEAVSLGPGTREKVRTAALAIQAGKGTPLGAAVKLATRALSEQKEVQLGYGEFNLVVVTDGQADDERDLQRAVKDANRAGMMIHTIGFCINDVSALKKGSVSYRSASDPAELREAVLGVLAEAEDFSSLEFEKVD